MTDDDQASGELEQYSQESREQLRDRAAALAAALAHHTAALLEMRGGTRSLATLFELNDEVRHAAAAWDDAVFDHTGTFPVAIESLDDDGADLDEGEDGADGPESSVAVSVVSRWDLDIIDPVAVVEAGRAAHQRMNPAETEVDSAARIGEGDIGQALYAVVHEYGEPWFEIPGVGTVVAHRVYLRRDHDQLPLNESNQDYDQPPIAPVGEILYSESW